MFVSMIACIYLVCMVNVFSPCSLTVSITGFTIAVMVLVDCRLSVARLGVACIRGSSCFPLV